jgi:hypothetical protein
MVTKYGLSSLSTSPSSGGSPFKFKVGKVFATVMDEKTPSKKVFDQCGGWAGIGTVLFKPYPASKTKDNYTENTTSNTVLGYSVAKPFFPNQKYIPLNGELILFFSLPSITTQKNNSNSTPAYYYITNINLWGNNHSNSQTADPEHPLGLGFDENANIQSLLPFEGDYILEGRFGNTLRFGSTNKINTKENFWSASGKNGNPITILTNGHKFGGEKLYVEDINKDSSALYLTSTQKVPLKVAKTKLNPLTTTSLPDKYIEGSQAILTADRVVINSKKENVLLFAQNNIELYTKNTISLDADTRTVINSPVIFLGMNGSQIPGEPVLLGNETVKLLNALLTSLSTFSTICSSALNGSKGSPITQLNTAARGLKESVDNLIPKLINIKSKKVRVAK